MSSEIENAGAKTALKVDVDSMVQNIQMKFLEILDEPPILCRIPDDIRGKHGSAYEPKVIAIGPYHRNNGGHGGDIHPRLLPMEENKLRYLNDLCKRSISRDGEINGVREKEILKTYITAVHGQEQKARKKYCKSSFEMNSEDFVKMLVLDACFIVELMLKQEERKLNFGSIPMTFQLKSKTSVCHDLLLFENQIPFFILEVIYANTNFKPRNRTIIDLALNYLSDSNDTTNEVFLEDHKHKEEIHHLLHLSHLCLTHESKTHKKQKTIPTATKLKEAGIQFRKKVISGRGNFLDVSFKDGIIEIPTVVITDNTLSKFRNLLALEQTSMEYKSKFTSYIVFMDDLIDTADDVALLMKSKIIENNIGSAEEVAKFFNEMCIGLTFYQYKSDMYKEINNYCDRKCNKWRAILIRDYLNSPWAVISLLGVFILLGLTTLQAVYSVKAVQAGK